jgi:hypothetical protein
MAGPQKKRRNDSRKDAKEEILKFNKFSEFTFRLLAILASLREFFRSTPEGTIIAAHHAAVTGLAFLFKRP